MRSNIIMVIGVGVALAGCGHSSHTSSSSSSTGTADQIKKNTPDTKTDPVVATAGGYPLDLKGVGLLGANGAIAPATLAGQVKSTDTSVIVSNGNPITLAYTGDGPLHGTIIRTARADGGDTDTVRFLMSDESINSKDAPTAFGVLVNKSSATEFAAGGLYGGKAATNIPQSGIASYTGKYAGVITENGKITSQSSGLYLKADFGSGTVDGGIDTALPIDNASMGFSATMSADKATYSGNSVTIDKGWGPEGVVVLNGKVEGGFYNEGASETAGAIAVGNADTSMVGTFHGEKQP